MSAHSVSSIPGASRSLGIERLTVSYDGVRVLHEVSFDIGAGETVGVAGESGSGKSTLGLAVLGLLPMNASVRGTITIGDVAFVAGEPGRHKAHRQRDVALIAQETVTALNPVMKIGTQLGRVLRARRRLTRTAAFEESREWLDRVQIRDPGAVMDRYPHELSGGMCQRVNIAMALACRPKVLVADEPTTALDVAVQKDVLSLLRRLASDQGVATLLISHDLGVLHEMAKRIFVFYEGKVVEAGSTQEVLASPRHPYTEALVAAVPTLTRPSRYVDIQGRRRVWDVDLHDGCPYQAHCPYRFDRCVAEPPLVEVGGSSVRCWRSLSGNPVADNEGASQRFQKATGRS